MGLILGMYSIVCFKQEKREALAQQFQALEARGEIAHLKMEMSSLADPVEWVTTTDHVKLSYVNASSGFFYFSDCYLTSKEPECVTELVAPPLQLTYNKN